MDISRDSGERPSLEFRSAAVSPRVIPPVPDGSKAPMPEAYRDIECWVVNRTAIRRSGFITGGESSAHRCSHDCAGVSQACAAVVSMGISCG